MELESLFNQYLQSSAHYFATISILEKGRDEPARILDISYSDDIDDYRLDFYYGEIQSKLVSNSKWKNSDAPTNFLKNCKLEKSYYSEDDLSPMDGNDKFPTPNDFLKHCLKDLAARNRELILYAVLPARANPTIWYQEVFDILIVPYMKMCGISQIYKKYPKEFDIPEITEQDIMDHNLEIKFEGPLKFFDVYRISEIINIKFDEYNRFNDEVSGNFATRFEMQCNKKFDVNIVLKTESKAVIVYDKKTNNIIKINEIYDVDDFIDIVYKFLHHIFWESCKVYIHTKTPDIQTKIMNSIDRKLLNIGGYMNFYENFTD